MKQTRDHTPVSASRRLELVLAGCLYASGLINLARWWTQRSGPGLSILCYHETSGGYLREHLLYLRRHYRILHLEAALEELYQPTKDMRKDHRPLLALTSDDGYHDLYSYALPLISELHVPLTVFLVPGYLANRERFWWQEPEYLLSRTSVNEITFAGKIYHLQHPTERQAFSHTLEKSLRNAASVAERETLLETLHTALAVPDTSAMTESEKALAPLTWAEVHEMEQSEWFSFGAHTMHHPTLACLSDSTELRYEVSECRTTLEQRLGHSVRVLAYPIGKEEHFAERDVQAVETVGYRWAVTTLHGLNTPQTGPYQLRRIVVDVDQHWLMIAAKTSGLWDFLVHLGRMPINSLGNMFK